MYYLVLIYLCCLLSQLQDVSQRGFLIALLLALQAEAFRQDTGSGRLWKLNLWFGQIIDSIYENWRSVSGLKPCLLMQLMYYNWSLRQKKVCCGIQFRCAHILSISCVCSSSLDTVFDIAKRL